MYEADGPLWGAGSAGADRGRGLSRNSSRLSCVVSGVTDAASGFISRVDKGLRLE